MYPINLRYIFGKRITQYDLVVKIVNRKSITTDLINIYNILNNAFVDISINSIFSNGYFIISLKLTNIDNFFLTFFDKLSTSYTEN